MKRLVILSIMLLSLGCSTTGKNISANQPTETSTDASSLSGKVIETMDSGKYTYVCLQKGNEKVWVAVYKMKVVVGQNMSFRPGIEMVNFESKTLKRKFDKIYFSGGAIETEKSK